MPPKRKAPLAIADAKANNGPPAKKAATPKTTAEKAGESTNAMLYKYSNPITTVNADPVPVTFIKWPKDEEESEDDEEEEEDNDPEFDEPNPEPGSLQAQLDIIENERSIAWSEVFKAFVQEMRATYVEEVREEEKRVSAPFEKRADQAREAFVKSGSMTLDEANAIKGVSEKDRKERRKRKRNYQEGLNRLQRECNAAIDKVLDKERAGKMTHEDAQARIIKEKEKLAKRIEEGKELTKELPSMREILEDIEKMQPNLKLDENGKEIPKPKTAAQLRKEAELAAFVAPRVVTQDGFPVSKAAMKKSFEIHQETDKRDPDMHGMYFFNDFAGYGVTEVMDNVMAEFNKVIFKKEVSPIEKWTIVEGLVTYLYLHDHTQWMMSNDADAIRDVINMFGVMFVTGLEMLHECHLLPAPVGTPLPDNIGILTLLLLEFLTESCSDFRLLWLHEIVRAADKYGVVLTIPATNQISITQAQLDKWRAKKGVTKGMDWKTKYQTFKRKHPGGTEYDITLMSKAEKARHKFSSRNALGFGWGGDSDSGSGVDDYDDDDSNSSGSFHRGDWNV